MGMISRMLYDTPVASLIELCNCIFPSFRGMLLAFNAAVGGTNILTPSQVLKQLKEQAPLD